MKVDCKNIKEHLGTFTVKEMEPLEVKGEITNYTADNEYEMIRNSTENVKKAVTLTSARLVIRFDEEGIIEDKFIVVTKLDDIGKKLKGQSLLIQSVFIRL